MLPITVTIPGPVRGWARARLGKSTDGKPRHFTDSKTRATENAIGWHLRAHWPAEPIKDALALTIEIRIAVPASWSKRKTDLALSAAILPTCKPDIDNVFKALADGGNKIVWHDDAQITRLYISRRYAADPGLTVTVEVA